MFWTCDISDSKKTDYIGIFALTAGLGAEEYCRKLEKEDHDDYSSIMVKVRKFNHLFAHKSYFRRLLIVWPRRTPSNFIEKSE